MPDPYLNDPDTQECPANYGRVKYQSEVIIQVIDIKTRIPATTRMQGIC